MSEVTNGKAVLVDEGLKNLYVCRTCLATDVKFLDIFQLNLDILFRSVGISVGLYDNFPRYICTFCWSLLKRSAQFHSQSQRAHISFLKLIGKGQFTASEINKLHNNLKLNLTKETQHSADIPPENIVYVKTEDLYENDTNIEIDSENDILNETDISNTTLRTAEYDDINENLNETKEIDTNVVKIEIEAITVTSFNANEKTSEILTTDLVTIEPPNEFINKDHTKPTLALPIDPLKCETDITDTVEYPNEIDVLKEDIVDKISVHENDLYSDEIEINEIFNENDTINFTAPRIPEYDENKNESLNRTEETETKVKKIELKTIKDTNFNDTEIETSEVSTDLTEIDLPNEVLNEDHNKAAILATTIGQLKYDTDLDECLHEINLLETDLCIKETEINDVLNEASHTASRILFKCDKKISKNPKKRKVKKNVDMNKNKIGEVPTDLAEIDLPNEGLNEDHNKTAILATNIGQLKYDTNLNECLNETNVFETDLCIKETEINNVLNESDSANNHTASKILFQYGNKKNENLNKSIVTKTKTSEVSTDLVKTDLNEVLNKDHNPASTIVKQKNFIDLTDPIEYPNEIDLCVIKTETNAVASNDAMDKTNKVVIENFQVAKNGLLKVSKEEYLNWLNTLEKKPKLESTLDSDDVEIFMVPNDDGSKKKYIVCKKVEKTKRVRKKQEKTNARDKLGDESDAIGIKKKSNRRNILVCDICGKLVISPYAFKLHMTTHTKEQPYSCDHCKKRFRTKPYLLRHILSLHMEVRPFKCHLCPKSYYRRTEFKRHKRQHITSLHLKLRPYKCDLCPKTYNRKTGLRRHKLTHTQTKPYECSVCGKCFYDSSARKVHLETVHRMIRNRT